MAGTIDDDHEDEALVEWSCEREKFAGIVLLAESGNVCGVNPRYSKFTGRTNDMNELDKDNVQECRTKHSWLRVYREGTGVPILFIHGYPLDSSFWSIQIEYFRKKHIVIAIDLRGFGRSEMASDSTEDPLDEYSMASLADDCIDGLDICGIRGPVVVCGLSMGGYVAFEIWKRHASRVSALILCDTRAGADNTETAKLRLVSADRVVKVGTAAVVTPMLERLLCLETRQTSPILVGELMKMMHSVPPTTIALAQRAMANRSDFESSLNQILQPTLLIVGESDVISTPQEMNAIATKIPNSSIRLIKDSGHLPPIEQPNSFNAAIEEFLERISSVLAF